MASLLISYSFSFSNKTQFHFKSWSKIIPIASKKGSYFLFEKNWRKGKQKGRALDAWTNSHLVLKKRALHGHSAPRDRLNSFFGPPWAFKEKKCLDWYQFRNVLNFVIWLMIEKVIKSKKTGENSNVFQQLNH